MEKVSKINFMDKAINGLRKAAVELEEFRVQLSLGKAVAIEKFEELKKKFQEVIHDSINKLREDKISASELIMKFEQVEKFLEEAKDETLEAFIEQKKKILPLVEEIEESLKNTAVDRDFYIKINTEIEKFKIKLEILFLRFELGKLTVKSEFESLKLDFAKKVDKMKVKFTEGDSPFSKNWSHFCDDLSEVYKHLKQAFTLS